MASRPRKSAATATAPPPQRRWRPLRWLGRGVVGMLAAVFLAILAYAVINPPTTPYMFGEGRRLGGVEQVWVPLEEIAPAMARAAVAAEDANFCLHWGLDLAAIRLSLEAGGERGASTISQQVVKNVYLWQGRSWLRKALEAAITPVVELVWTKRRVLEVYLNVAEFGEGVFGVQAAAQYHFGVDAADLSDLQAARLAAVLPDPKGRSAGNPGPLVRRRTSAIMSGAETIAADGRADCFGG